MSDDTDRNATPNCRVWRVEFKDGSSVEYWPSIMAWWGCKPSGNRMFWERTCESAIITLRGSGWGKRV